MKDWCLTPLIRENKRTIAWQVLGSIQFQFGYEIEPTIDFIIDKVNTQLIQC